MKKYNRMSDHYVLIDHTGGPNGNMFGSRSCMIWGPSQNGSHHECRETLSKDSLFLPWQQSSKELLLVESLNSSS